jgi:hypothetical protein
MKLTLVLAACAALATTVPSGVAAAETKMTASNGVVIDVNGDDFSNRYEYSAPSAKPDDGEGFFLVAAIDKNGTKTGVMATGSIYYNGEWRFYDQALFRGGESAPGVFGDREVVSCRGSRYSQGCSLREGFQINLTDALVQKHAVNGNVQVQLRAKGLYPVMITIPISYYTAVKEALASH